MNKNKNKNNGNDNPFYLKMKRLYDIENNYSFNQMKKKIQKKINSKSNQDIFNYIMMHYIIKKEKLKMKIFIFSSNI